MKVPLASEPGFVKVEDRNRTAGYSCLIGCLIGFGLGGLVGLFLAGLLGSHVLWR